jgi:PAS domain S-box-containing protein
VEIEKPVWLADMEGIFETLNEGVIIVDDCQNMVFSNAVFREMTGFSEDHILGGTVATFYTPEETRILAQHREHGLRVGHNRFEFVLPRTDGSRLPVVVSARRFEDPDGREFAVITFTDISEQKLAESQLREANSKLEDRQKEIEEELALAG